MASYTFANGEQVEIKDENRFSLFLPKGHCEMEDLEKWRAWFCSRGINACLVEVVGKGFAVYRNGMRQETYIDLTKRGVLAQSEPPKIARQRGRPRKEI